MKLVHCRNGLCRTGHRHLPGRKGNDVTCVDIDGRKIAQLQRGEVPIYEPGLAELVERNVASRPLHFTTDLAAAVATDRQADLPGRRHSAGRRRLGRSVEPCGESSTRLAPHLTPQMRSSCTKSTVPVGTNAA